MTGSHDEGGVGADEVGAGLQSLLELAINRAGGAAPDVDWIIGLEEPEAFLHPAAQRLFARTLPTDEARLIVSTHSPIVVDEARYEELVLVRDHRFYYPRSQPEAAKQAANTALLTGDGAEMVFARGVLLVEGPGDRQFFEGLRRRLARDSAVAAVDSLWVLSVGGKAFGPWLRLLRSFGDEADRPIRWRVIADDDAATDVLDAYREAGHALSTEVRAELQTLSSEFSANGRSPATASAADRANALSAREPRAPFLLAGELEETMLRAASDQTVRRIAAQLGEGCPSDKSGLVAHLRNDKAKWKRAVVARELPWTELDGTVRLILEAWLAEIVGSAQARSALRDL